MPLHCPPQAQVWLRHSGPSGPHLTGVLCSDSSSVLLPERWTSCPSRQREPLAFYSLLPLSPLISMLLLVDPLGSFSLSPSPTPQLQHTVTSELKYLETPALSG